MKKEIVIQKVGMALLMAFLVGAMISACSVQSFQQQVDDAAEGGVRSIGIIGVENENAEFEVRVNVDKQNRCYTEDDPIVVTVKSNSDGFLYLLHIDSSGTKTMLIPNKYQANNEIKAHQEVVYPVEESTFRFLVTGPSFGKEMIKAFVTKERLKSVDIAQFSIAPAKEITQTQSNGIADELTKSITIEGKPENQQTNFATHEVVYETFSKKTGAPVPTKGERFFVGFGVQKFKDSSITPLSACVADVKTMCELATKYLGVPEEYAAAITDTEVTLDTVRKTFCDVLPKITKPGDTIFVYWSGHGGRISAIRGDDTTGSFVHFLVPYDGDTNNPRETMLMEGPFGHWTQKLDGRNLIFILDACHSKGMTNAKSIPSGGKSSTNGFSLTNSILGTNTKTMDAINESDAPFTFAFKPLSRSKALGQNGLTVIASSASEELSFERREGNLSVMTYFLVDAIKKGPKSMTHKDICSTIEAPVQTYMKKNYPYANQTVLEQDDLNPAILLKP